MKEPNLFLLRMSSIFLVFIAALIVLTQGTQEYVWYRVGVGVISIIAIIHI